MRNALRRYALPALFRGDRTRRYVHGLAAALPEENRAAASEATRARLRRSREALTRARSRRARRRTPPGGSEWSAMQTLGHMIEMIPYWLNHCRNLISATGTPPAFGRTPGSPERLAGVAHGASADPEALLRQLHEEVKRALDPLGLLNPGKFV